MSVGLFLVKVRRLHAFSNHCKHEFYFITLLTWELYSFLPLTCVFLSSGLYAGIKFFIIDFLFKSCPKLRDKYDTPYIVWNSLPTDPQLKERTNATVSRRVRSSKHNTSLWPEYIDIQRLVIQRADSKYALCSWVIIRQVATAFRPRVPSRDQVMLEWRRSRWRLSSAAGQVQSLMLARGHLLKCHSKSHHWPLWWSKETGEINKASKYRLSCQ